MRSVPRVLLALNVLAIAHCGDDDGSGGGGTRLPLVTPPVRQAAPAALDRQLGASPRRLDKALSLDVGDVRQRFFRAGPTNIYQLLTTLDERIAEINSRSASSGAGCLTQSPVAYDIDPFGRTFTFYAQCYESRGSAADFLAWGQQGGTTFLYIAEGAMHIAARLTPQTGGGDGGTPVYAVDAWIGVGYNNAGECGDKLGFDSCSYGAIELHADAATRAFELAVAGVGFGYCGAQLQSDGSQIYALGSLDMGSTCVEPRSACVDATSLSELPACSDTRFQSTALGRTMTQGSRQSFGPSLYPGGSDNQIRLDGSATDSLSFGPSAPPAGVGAFTLDK
jgi:hypothetical protein